MTPRRVATGPVQSCQLCGRSEAVVPDGRGFPPRIAENRLRRKCAADGCPCDPRYTAGTSLLLEDGR